MQQVQLCAEVYLFLKVVVAELPDNQPDTH